MERLNAAEGDSVELEKVLLIADGDKIITGKPIIEQAKVVATVKGESKDKKIIVLKYKAKTRYSKKTGHRQTHTKLAIDNIVSPELNSEKPAKKATRQSKSEVNESGS